MDSLLEEFVKFDHLPADFDDLFFKNVTEKFFASDLISLSTLKNVISNNPSNRVLRCTLIAVMGLSRHREEAVQLFINQHQELIRFSNDCSVLQNLTFSLFFNLEHQTHFPEEVERELINSAITSLINERTNVVSRRTLAQFLVYMARKGKLNEQSSTNIFNHWLDADNANILDNLSSVLFVFIPSTLFKTQEPLNKFMDKITELHRPGQNVIKLVANVISHHSNLISVLLASKHSCQDQKALVMIVAELLQRTEPQLHRELLQFLGENTKHSVDDIIDHIDEYEQTFPANVDEIRRQINASLPYPKKCSSSMLTRYLDYLKSGEGISSTSFCNAFLAIQPRLRTTPELYDDLLSDIDEIDKVLQNKAIKKMLVDITIDVIKVKNFPNWALVDSAIVLLDKLHNILDYDEELINNRMMDFIKLEEHQDIDYIKCTAAKFLIKNQWDLIKSSTKELYLHQNDSELRISLLDKLLLSPSTDISETDLVAIFDDVLVLESNLEIKKHCLMLMKKFSTTATSEKISELEENIKEEEEKQADKDGVEKLIQMVELVKTSCDCFDDHVAKECY